MTAFTRYAGGFSILPLSHIVERSVFAPEGAIVDVRAVVVVETVVITINPLEVWTRLHIHTRRMINLHRHIHLYEHRGIISEKITCKLLSLFPGHLRRVFQRPYD